MNQYKVSIIVPVYNTGKPLLNCVKTLVEQSYKNLEILLVDDGSTDGSGKLCDDLALHDARIHVIHKENGGLISAWKKGVSKSSGEYLCFVDSDDWIDLNMIEEMAMYLTGSGREIVASDYVMEREDGSSQFVWQGLGPGEYDRKAIEQQVIPNLLGREHRYVHHSRCMKLISRKLIENNCKYSNPMVTMGEDTTVILPSLIDCERLVIMDHKAYYHYLYVGSSIVHKYDKNLYANIRLLRQNIEEILADKFTGEELAQMMKKADQEFVLMMFLVLKNEARGNASGYRKNLLDICRSEEIRTLCRNTCVSVEEKANKLVYLVLRHPNEITVRLLRLAMIIYYRKPLK